MKELEKLSEAKKRLESFIKDEYIEEGKAAIADLLSAQAQSDVEEVEVCVPVKAVNRRINLESVEIMDTTKGVLFIAKGGLTTLVSPRMVAVYNQLIEIINLMENDFKDAPEESRNDLEIYAQAWLYILQSPIFCALDAGLLFETASMLLQGLKKKADEVEKASLQSEDPVKDAEFANAIEATAKPVKQCKPRKKKA